MKDRIALLSVYNKEGIVDFAREIKDLGFKILASGGTAKVLTDAGIEVTDAATLVGGGAILGHRVVTLSREIHAGLLARDTEEDRKELADLKIPFIDLVCVDLYPLSEEIAKWEGTLTRPAGTLSQRERGEMVNAVLEKTDIGGPTMLRSAAKGRRIVICEAADRMKVVEWLKNGERDRDAFIASLCAKAEYIVAEYCLESARYHSLGKYDGVIREEILACKYGENGWQVPAGLYAQNADESARYNDALSLAHFKLVAGAPPSYNNLADLDRLLQTVTHIAAGLDTNFGKVPYICVGVKHGNACGAGIGENPEKALKKMLEGDLRAIFGGVVMVNFEITDELAEILLTHKMDSGRRLLDGIIAPSFSTAAIETLKRKGDKCRFLVNKALGAVNKTSLDTQNRFRYVRGGFLKQPNYTFLLDLSKSNIQTVGRIDSSAQMDIVLAWAVGCTSNSNTVTIVKDGQLLGNGVGQQDRVGCCELAIKRALDAGHNIAGAAAYSDSFFPFVDAPQTLAKAGIKTIFSSSGSVRDEEVKKFCQDNGVSLVMAPDSEARGFYNH